MYNNSFLDIEQFDDGVFWYIGTPTDSVTSIETVVVPGWLKLWSAPSEDFVESVVVPVYAQV